MQQSSFRCIAHRGAAGHAPENTLLSIRRALELGAAGVEIDVYLVDEQLVVFHDDRLERTTNGRGRIAEQSFRYLRGLDAGGGQQIPTLEEVCAEIDRRAALNIELKGPGTAAPVAERMAELLGRGWSRDQLLVSSFDRSQLSEMRRLDSRAYIGVLVDGPPTDDIDFAGRLKAFSVHPDAAFVDRRFVDAAHAVRLKIYAYTVNAPEAIVRMHDLGVDGVFSDFPDRVLERFPEAARFRRWC